MARFQMEKEQHPWQRMLLSAAVFLCFLGLFLAGVDSVSESTRRRQRESLETAIANFVVAVVGVQALFEVAACGIVSGALGQGLNRVLKR